MLVSPDIATKIWDVLVDGAGAKESMREDFLFSVRDHDISRELEFRFCGNLGFGGKIYLDSDRARVSCYYENETDERRKIISDVNTKLKEIMEQHA